MTHVTMAELADLVEGRADSAARTRLEAHLAGCAECARERAQIEKLVQLMRTDRTPEPVASVVARAVKLFAPGPAQSRGARVRAWLAGLEEVAARLVFDSFREPSFATARGRVSNRRLRFEAATVELDLQIDRRAGRLGLTGQVIDMHEPGARAVAGGRYLVVARDVALAAGETDATGEFTTVVEDRPGLVVLVATGGRAISFPLSASLDAGSDSALPAGE